MDQRGAMCDKLATCVFVRDNLLPNNDAKNPVGRGRALKLIGNINAAASPFAPEMLRMPELN